MNEEIKDKETKVDKVNEPAVGYALNEYPMKDVVSEVDYEFRTIDHYHTPYAILCEHCSYIQKD